MKTSKIEALLKALRTKIPTTLPTINTKKMSVKTAPLKTQKLPGIAPASQKNPIKVAEQTQNKDIKDMKMREAKDALKINKSTGQWSLEKKAPSGVDPEKHERCVHHLKDQGKNIGSAHAICTSAMKKDEQSEIDMGTEEEKEHADTLKLIASDAKAGKLKSLEFYTRKIAKEHVSKVKDYYTKLKTHVEKD